MSQGLTLFDPGFNKITARSAAAGAGNPMTVDLWETFEFAAGAGGVTATPLHTNDHAASGSWSVSDASSVLSTSASGKKTMLTTVNGSSDSGSLGLAYSLAGGHSAYVDYVFASAPNAAAVSFGCWFFLTSGLSSGTYTLIAPFGGSSLGNIDATVNNGGASFTLLVGASSPTSSVAWNQWYWVTAKVQKSSAYSLTLYDSTGALIAGTSTSSTTAGAVDLTQMVFGNVNSPPANAATIFYDNIVIDWSHAVYPILPI